MKSPRQIAVRKLDAVFSKFIRLRDAPNGYGTCCSCGNPTLYGNGDAGHFINRKHFPTRWHEENVHFQCRSCNRFDEGNAAGYALFMLEKYGKDKVEYLRALSREPSKFTAIEIELLIQDYKKKTKELDVKALL